MKCQICSKIMFSRIKCDICNNIFCSTSCLESHIYSNHQSLVYSKFQIYEKPKLDRIINGNIQKPYSIYSPYITNGYILNEIKYESKYNLKNFTPIMEHNSPKIIGIGSYGKVYLYKNITDNKLYAIKHLNKMILCKSIHTIKRIYDEINIQSRIYHQNIVRLLNVKENDDSIYLLMEYAKNGSLFNYIRNKRFLTEEESFRFFSQIINAIYFLHKNDFIHRDIKPENILIFDNGECKLCDFGCCVELNGKQRSTFCGTTEYMSPEIVNKIKYSKEIDIWSLGILLYEMVHGYSPFKPNKINFNAKEVIDKIKIHEIKFNINISKECKELIIHLLDENVENRYKIEDIFNSNFIKKYEKINFYFLNEKFPINNIKNERNILNNNSDKKVFENPLLLSSLIENDNIINKTLFNNFKYKSSNEYNMENKINNVVFNNIINRNPNNVKVKNSEKHRQLITQRELNRNRNLINNNSLNSSKEALNFNSSRMKKNVKVKVTKLSSTSLILNDGIKPNISYVKKINNDSDNLTDDFSFLNISSIKDKDNQSGVNLIDKRYQSIKLNENKINKLTGSYSIQDINKKNYLNNENEQDTYYMKIYPRSVKKEKSFNKNNYNFKREIDIPKIKEQTNINNNYYIKPKIEKDFHYPKDNSKHNEKNKDNILHFKYCLNSKIKIPRRKILNSLQLENKNILNNIDLIHNNEISSLNSSNQLNSEFIQMEENSNEFSFTDNYKNNTHRVIHNDRYDPYLKDNNTIKTQINKNYLFNPKISINLPKYSFSNQKIYHNKNNVKIREISEDFKDKIIPQIDLSKSQNFQKNFFKQNVKNYSSNNLLNTKSQILRNNNINPNEKIEISRLMTKRKIPKAKISNYSPSELNYINNKKNIISKTKSNSVEKSNEFYNIKKKYAEILENKKINVKQREINKEINYNLIKNNKPEKVKLKEDYYQIKNNYIKPITERNINKKISNELNENIKTESKSKSKILFSCQNNQK